MLADPALISGPIGQSLIVSKSLECRNLDSNTFGGKGSLAGRIALKAKTDASITLKHSPPSSIVFQNRDSMLGEAGSTDKGCVGSDSGICPESANNKVVAPGVCSGLCLRLSAMRRWRQQCRRSHGACSQYRNKEESSRRQMDHSFSGFQNEFALSALFGGSCAQFLRPAPDSACFWQPGRQEWNLSSPSTDSVQIPFTLTIILESKRKKQHEMESSLSINGEGPVR